jgi:hypothetical protein
VSDVSNKALMMEADTVSETLDTTYGKLADGPIRLQRKKRSLYEQSLIIGALQLSHIPL